MGEDILVNRRAYHDYHVVETLEAGIQLRGPEVKSLRLGRGNVAGSFARVEDGEAWLYHMDIQPYQNQPDPSFDPKAKRKLLLHKAEIRRLEGKLSIRGRTLIPLKLYWKNRKIKVLLGLAEGKSKGDKREALKEREAQKEIARALRRRRN
ncbi:SsrA-binding protein SmpB [Candidatus Methylacidithermus pantelleriae]|uniref:SsrA-binding protein n=1 Tax=Candidatus Methylacidithermus pantelleriae TaxID=2744239 RepID=A0A8J2BN88_9BACT|nr:SsrA-binding protein SmpB [Candidatus Methylacidithermus pantelleriae]CAF0704498.1 SsrA-binding protein [Candidatus Methylacidithermus pantelleriae]